eukprot:748947-Ditylum_brightwellii.AAC.1
MQHFVNASTADRESFASPTSTNSHLHTTIQELTSANANTQATINTMQQQMAMIVVTPPNQTAQPPPQQLQSIYGGQGNYGMCGKFYRGRER